MNPNDLQALSSFVTTVGFPVFVACVLLYQVYVMHVANIKAVAALTQEVALLRQFLEKHK